MARAGTPTITAPLARTPVLRDIGDYLRCLPERTERRLFARSPRRAVNTLRDCRRACGRAQVRAGLADICGGIAGRVGRWLRYWAGVPSASGWARGGARSEPRRCCRGGRRGCVASWQRVTGRWVTVTGKRRERGALIAFHLAQPCQSDRDCMLTRTHDSRHRKTFSGTEWSA